MFYQEILKRKKVLENQIQQLKQKLAQYPAGHMICVRNGKYIKNIHVHDGIQTNIPKKNINLVKELAEKKYFSARLEDLLNEQSAVNTFLEHYQPYPSKTQQLMNHPIYQKVITSSMTPLSDELEKWAKDSYEKNPAYPEQLRHSCLSRQKVRSKSEVLIAQALFLHQIPFRYECALKLNDLTFFPDFTIRHPETGQFFYWEHFGRMDSLSYSQNAFQKLQIYSANGYIPTIHLITSYETQNHPLTTETIENLIQQYFY